MATKKQVPSESSVQPSESKLVQEFPAAQDPECRLLRSATFEDIVIGDSSGDGKRMWATGQSHEIYLTSDMGVPVVKIVNKHTGGVVFANLNCCRTWRYL